MKILHTSDWHLGRGLSGFDLSDAQEAAVNQIVDAAITLQVELVLIAGDIFDRTIPAVEDIRIFNDALIRLNEAQIKTIVTSGNHDQGSRLAAYNQLLTENLWVVGRTEDSGKPIVLTDEHGPVVVYPIPYLEPDGARHTLAHPDGTLLDRSHDGVFQVVMDRIRVDFAVRKQENPLARSIVIAHAFVARAGTPKAELEAEKCESQRDISVGGIEIVDTNRFAGMNYVALGHLHGGREVKHSLGTDTHIRYSGSILRYSLSEMKHDKSFTIVELDESGVVRDEQIQIVGINQPRGMFELRGTMEELLSDSFTVHHKDFVRLVVVEEKPEIHYYAQLQQKYLFILSHTVVNPLAGEVVVEQIQVQSVDQLQPLAVMENFFKFARSQEPSQAQKLLMQKYLEKASKDLGSK